MAVEGIRITVIDEAIASTLARIDRVAESPASIMSEISAYMVMRTQRHIETETGPTGRWPALSPRTAAARIGRGRRGSEHMLRVSNRLYSSITGESSATEATAGTNVLYAAIQQFGGTIKRPEREQTIHLGRSKGRTRFVKASAKRAQARTVKVGAHAIKIPARPYLYLDDEDFREIERIAESGFRKEAGL